MLSHKTENLYCPPKSTRKHQKVMDCHEISLVIAMKKNYPYKKSLLFMQKRPNEELFCA